MKLKSRVPHHILPVEHFQDVAKQLAAGLRLFPLLQVELQLLRHQRQEDLAAICGEGGKKKQKKTHTLTTPLNTQDG